MITNAISFTAAISAFETGKQGEQALALLQEMREFIMITNVISFLAAISASRFGKAQYTRSKLCGEWEQALALLRKTRGTGKTANTALKATLACREKIGALSVKSSWLTGSTRRGFFMTRSVDKHSPIQEKHNLANAHSK